MPSHVPPPTFEPGRDYRDYAVQERRDGRLLTTGQAGVRLRLSPETIRTRIKQGVLPAARGSQPERRRHLVPSWAVEGYRAHLGLPPEGDMSRSVISASTATRQSPTGKTESSGHDPNPEDTWSPEAEAEAQALRERVSQLEDLAAGIGPSRERLQRADELLIEAYFEARRAYYELDEFVHSLSLSQNARWFQDRPGESPAVDADGRRADRADR